MTDREKAEIFRLRNCKQSYTQIAQVLNMPVSTVKSFCRRKKISAGVQEGSVCECCGKPIMQKEVWKRKRFCSDACRMKWWNHHTGDMKSNATCVHCGKRFHGRAGRKYCSHACYIAERFGDAHVS